MAWLRNHYYCEACDGTWLAAAELVVEADCPFCAARDVFPYKNDTHVAGLDAPTMARRLAVTMRRAVRPARPRAPVVPAKAGTRTSRMVS
jgi:hypothetical protein